jgi:predicted unusual protein kinase regulating ubiquinone biosynthesis (AarF/ABC1/UbiB family)
MSRRWETAVHAMQTCVAYEMNKERDPPTEPKHLRVGINTAMADQEGIVRLLIRKGIFTEEEYFEAIADSMEARTETLHRPAARERHSTLGDKPMSIATLNVLDAVCALLILGAQITIYRQTKKLAQLYTQIIANKDAEIESLRAHRRHTNGAGPC